MVVAAMPFVDANRLGIAGASYGGYAVDWLGKALNSQRCHESVFT
jgi:dipeptidyl aminopeptidase/acylaminoacyl peptidase